MIKLNFKWIKNQRTVTSHHPELTNPACSDKQASLHTVPGSYQSMTHSVKITCGFLQRLMNNTNLNQMWEKLQRTQNLTELLCYVKCKSLYPRLRFRPHRHGRIRLLSHVVDCLSINAASHAAALFSCESNKIFEMQTNCKSPMWMIRSRDVKKSNATVRQQESVTFTLTSVTLIMSVNTSELYLLMTNDLHSSKANIGAAQ